MYTETRSIICPCSAFYCSTLCHQSSTLECWCVSASVRVCWCLCATARRRGGSHAHVTTVFAFLTLPVFFFFVFFYSHFLSLCFLQILSCCWQCHSKKGPTSYCWVLKKGKQRKMILIIKSLIHSLWQTTKFLHDCQVYTCVTSLIDNPSRGMTWLSLLQQKQSLTAGLQESKPRSGGMLGGGGGINIRELTQRKSKVKKKKKKKDGEGKGKQIINKLLIKARKAECVLNNSPFSCLPVNYTHTHSDECDSESIVTLLPVC